MLESRHVEPVAIVGIGCRFPGGVTDVRSFWSLLIERRSGIVDVPADRWHVERFYHAHPAAPGAMVMRRGGFVDNVAMFDAAFWGISPREAVRMDPQQRWLLEVAWEAIEDAGHAPSRLRGHRIGVFIGISGNDYGGLQLRSTEDVDAYTNSGSTASIAANRVSYLLDLRGPSISLDTACSSSLVAVAAACEGLWSGGCEGALAGGVNALISPQTSIGFSKASMISPSGNCFAFDARADGFVRAEGAGIVYLKPLSVALSAGDRIYAVVRAAVVNQDGHTSSMTVPGLDGQTAMLEEAYRRAGLSPAGVAYVEAHGTGTPVGDPIEAAALGRVLGRDRSAGSRCLIGSVKTNIGHLESGSGIAGLIKAALVLHHRTIPATLNYERPNPNIPLDDLRLEIAADTRALSEADGRLPVVGVNAFGFGGTNAHAVLEAVPTLAEPPSDVPTLGALAARPHLLPISARDERALRTYVQTYRDVLADVSLPLADLCASAGDRKEQHPHRLVIVGRSREELRRRAATWLHDGGAEGIVAGRSAGDTAPVFVFAGQGPQWWAMGRQLLEREPLFRDVMRNVDATVQRVAGWSLLTEMRRPEDQSRIDHTDIAQPAMFALQAGLIALWNSWGVHAAKAIGHSVGEVAAAYCAGVYSLEDAARIVVHRARLQHRTFGGGRMLAVAVSEADARAAIGARTDVELAAINSPRLMTLAGGVESLARIEREFQRSGAFTRWLRGHYAFHSAQMDPVRADVLEALRGIVPQCERIPLMSTVTAAPISGESLDAAYWWQNIRQPVLFGPGLSGLIDAGDRTFLEIGPHPVLESAMKECLAERGHKGAVCHSLRREVDESDELAVNLAGLHLAGTGIDWTSVNHGSGRVVPQPQYPWSRERFWIESEDSARLRLAPAAHPLLGQRIEAAHPTWQVLLDLSRHAYLKDHRVWDTVVFPAAAYLEIGLALGRTLFAGEPHAVEQLKIRKALFLAEHEPVTLQIVFSDEDRSFGVYSAAQGGRTWELHAQGVLTRLPGRQSAAISVEALCARLEDRMDHDAYCRQLGARGYQFGPAFSQVRQLWRRDTEVLVEIDPPRDVAESAAGYVFHPAILDACFHAFLALPPAGAPEGSLYLPESVQRLHVYREVTASRLWAHATDILVDGSFLEGNIGVFGEHGERVADVLGFRIKAVEQKTPADALDNCYYQFAWEPRRLRGSGVQGGCDFAGNAEIVRAVTTALPDVESRYGIADYRAFVRAAEPVVSRLVERAFVFLGWRPDVGERLEFDAIFEALGVAEDYRRVTRRLLGHLERTGVLESIGPAAWRVARLPESFDADAALDQLVERYPSCRAEVALYRRTGLKLAGILTGDIDPLELLFPAGSHELMERFYAEALGGPANLELTRRAVETSIAALPSRRVLRVLEVGAGTGVLTRTVLPALPAHRTEYTFTDAGTAFIAAARKRLAGTPVIDFRVFDLEIAPERQQIPTGEFDLILGGDVVHATSDLRMALGHLRQCLAPGGLLLLLELAKPHFLRDDVSFGVLRGYSRFRDRDLRPDSALASASAWRQAFEECGFADVQAIDCSTDPAGAEHAILLGSAPGALADQATGRGGQLSHFVLVADRGGTADRLANELAARGHAVSVVSDSDDNGQILNAIDEGAASRALAGVIHCRSLDAPAASTLTVDQLRGAQTDGLESAVQLIRATADRDTKICFVTRQAQPVGASDMVGGLASSPLIGMVRVANNEHHCRFKTIDLDGCPPDIAATLLADEVTLPSDGEFEVAYRDDVRHVRRLQRADSAQLLPRTFNAVGPDGSVEPFRLETRAAGILANLALHETDRIAPAPQEVEVRVRAAGLNFRDIMKALGTHPGNPPDLLWFGADLSGVVERVGELVTDLRPGDDVAGIAPYAFRSYARTDARLLFRKPADLSFAQAATIPTIFLTAHYAINHLARMQPGESILIHAGTGGVGQAAIQVATHRSLEIFATAGTPEKRRLLSDMGVHHVMSSRTLEFADEVMRATGGRGVDAVLNSLAGDFIPKSLSVLAPFGRFLEIGKVDVYRNTRIGLESLRHNVSYFVIDLTQHLSDRRDAVAQLFADITERFAAGDYRVVPITAFPVTEAVDAFRFMAQGKHIGKNVLTFDHGVIPIALTTNATRRFRPDATYLITGGAGGFGLEVAQWIARHGGRHVALMSRTGPRDAAAQALLAELRAQGATVLDVRGDVTSSEDVRHAIDRIGRELPPLKGVFHAAMVLDDDPIVELDEQRLWKALAPKMAGAWNLHVATERVSLDHFVCFSSFSSIIGLLRQGNYNAGNAFLDALAHYRRARSLPALTINWGAIRGAGFVERDRKTSEVLTKLGFGFFQKDEALRVLDDLLVRDTAQVAAARAEWGAALKFSPLMASSNTYAALVHETHAADRARSLDAQLRAATTDEQERLLTQFIVTQVAGVFGTEESKIDLDARLTDLGLDSLMTLELTNRVERELGIRLPAGTLLSGPTIVELARHLRQMMAPAIAATDAAPARVSGAAETPSSWQNDPHDHLVVIKPGSGIPVFCFHPLGGGVGIYGGLSAHVPDDVPLIGVESRLVRGAAAEYGTVAEMVDAYVAAVRSAHRGPYRLVGFSLGGYLAARVAQVFDRTGDHVEFVGVLDWDVRQETTPAAQREALVRLSIASYLFLQQEMGILRPRPEPQLHDEIRALVDRVMSDTSSGRDTFYRWVVDNELTTSRSLEELARQYLVRFEQHCRLLTHALPRPDVSVPLIVWRASDGFGSGLDSWGRGDGLAREHVFEGDHNALMRPAALKQVAEQMMDFLQTSAGVRPDALVNAVELR